MEINYFNEETHNRYLYGIRYLRNVYFQFLSIFDKDITPAGLSFPNIGV